MQPYTNIQLMKLSTLEKGEIKQTIKLLEDIKKSRKYLSIELNKTLEKLKSAIR